MALKKGKYVAVAFLSSRVVKNCLHRGGDVQAVAPQSSLASPSVPHPAEQRSRIQTAIHPLHITAHAGSDLHAAQRFRTQPATHVHAAEHAGFDFHAAQRSRTQPAIHTLHTTAHASSDIHAAQRSRTLLSLDTSVKDEVLREKPTPGATRERRSAATIELDAIMPCLLVKCMWGWLLLSVYLLVRNGTLSLH
eukprot:3985830-Pleurochrysis_carterae.AAC.2